MQQSGIQTPSLSADENSSEMGFSDFVTVAAARSLPADETSLGVEVDDVAAFLPTLRRHRPPFEFHCTIGPNGHYYSRDVDDEFEGMRRLGLLQRFNPTAFTERGLRASKKRLEYLVATKPDAAEILGKVVGASLPDLIQKLARRLRTVNK